MWHVVDIIDGVKVRNERHSDPVRVVDLVIAADDSTKFARLAGAQTCGCLSADVVEIDRCMAGWIEGSKLTIGLLHKESYRSSRSHGGKETDESSEDAKVCSPISMVLSSHLFLLRLALVAMSIIQTL